MTTIYSYLRNTAFFATLICSTATLRADVRLPAIISDHMVLQKSAKTRIWGKADPGEKIKVTLGTISGQADTGTDGRWQVILDLTPSPAGRRLSSRCSRAVSPMRAWTRSR